MDVENVNVLLLKRRAGALEQGSSPDQASGLPAALET